MKIEKIREFFKADVFAMEMGAVIDEVGEGYAVCSLNIVKPNHYNAGHGIQGGVIFTLGDFAFAVAANARGNLTVSLNNTISFMNAVKGQKLIAKAQMVSETKRTCVYEVDIYDDLNTPVSRMLIQGYIKDKKVNF